MHRETVAMIILQTNGRPYAAEYIRVDEVMRSLAGPTHGFN